ncbi:Fic family protein [Streptomyces sp. AM2-3-1]|uniref:Fic family protein n=1 Tax=Streptomyces sp. AM2-3-1 TaxID=3075824 RepID=UPI0028C434BD|nr:Fic family protein [Streptomyces sp. AM2-3-1]WNO62409.1 Fic family protein [Streptomyces sp. AM2-3-1]WNO69537.1 Fic family protein [Streptomyces sp. AM2-3-1]
MTTDSLDSLAVWCTVRDRVDWVLAGAGTQVPVAPAVDGLTGWFDGEVRHRCPQRADRLLDANALARIDAAHRRALTPALLAGWQRIILGRSEITFRDGDAFAKGGRERYGLTPSTWPDFARCLQQSTDPALPLAARAARAYLDVAFFHPFPDGNARLALLTLAYVLDLDGVRLDQVAPLQTARYTDDPAGAADLAALVAILIRASHRRAAAPAMCGERPRRAPVTPPSPGDHRSSQGRGAGETPRT